MIHGIDDSVASRLRRQAEAHGRSVEDEARAILTASVAGRFATGREIYDAIRAELGEDGGADLEIPPREPIRDRRLFD